MERNKSLKEFSQQLRTNPTKEEFLLWNKFLRKYPIQFRRQYVIGNYIADFYCHTAKLVVELDGSQHYEQAGIEADQARDAYLQSLGLTVLRYSNADINQRFQGVCEHILQHFPTSVIA